MTGKKVSHLASDAPIARRRGVISAIVMRQPSLAEIVNSFAVIDFAII
jgi:hypothetical protein